MLLVVRVLESLTPADLPLDAEVDLDRLNFSLPVPLAGDVDLDLDLEDDLDIDRDVRDVNDLVLVNDSDLEEDRNDSAVDSVGLSQARS